MSQATSSSSTSYRYALFAAAAVVVGGIAWKWCKSRQPSAIHRSDDEKDISIKRTETKTSEDIGEEFTFSVSDDVRKLFAKYCGVSDDQTIIQRVEQARTEATRIQPYRCIREYRFVYPRICVHPYYLKLLWEINNKRILDIGCCMGTDIRQLILDGASAQNVMGVELEEEFIRVGYQLFGDPKKMADRFIICDVLSLDVENQNMALSSFLYPRANSVQSLSRKNLNAPGGPGLGVDVATPQQLDAIYCGSVFHLLDKEQSYALARTAFRFLSTSAAYCGASSTPFAISSPTSSSGSSLRVSGRGVFFGRTVGSGSDKAFDRTNPRAKSKSQLRYMHSVASLRKMLVDVGFVNVEVTVGAPFSPRQEEDGKPLTMLFFTAFLP